MKHSLEERVAYLEEKVKQLESRLPNDTKSNERKPIQTELKTSKHQPVSSIFTDQEPEPESSKVRAPRQVHSKKQSNRKSESIEWEVLIFQKVVPRVFIIILILGVLWGLKASYDYGIITIQVILTFSIALSVIMAVLGILQMNKNRRVLGQVLIGGAIPIFMLTIFSMHQMYDMIGPGMAMTMNLVAIVTGVVFTHSYRSESIGIISVIAGIFVPYLIESVAPNFYVFVAYETILYFVFLSLALYLHMRALYFVSTLFLHIAILGMHLFSPVPPEFVLVTIIPIVFQQIALLIGLLLTKVNLKIQVYTLLSSLLLTSLWVTSLLAKSEATTIFIGLTLMHAITFYFFQTDPKRAPIFIMNATLTFLFIFLVHDLNIAYEILIFTTMIHLFYSNQFKSNLHYLIVTIQYIIAFALFSSYYVDAWISYALLHKITFIVATIAMLYFIKKRISVKKINQFGLPFVALLLLSFSVDLTELITLESDTFDSMPLILSSFWVIIAIGYMVYGKITAEAVGKFIGIAILFLTVAKVVLFDISFMSMTLRAILFIGLGLIGLIISRVYNKSASNSK